MLFLAFSFDLLAIEKQHAHFMTLPVFSNNIMIMVEDIVYTKFSIATLKALNAK